VKTPRKKRPATSYKSLESAQLEIALLNYIKEHPGCLLSDLAAFYRQPESAIKRRLAPYIEDGLIKREPHFQRSFQPISYTIIE
jgi:DNA-binding MarR family transcriptional regulator